MTPVAARPTWPSSRSVLTAGVALSLLVLAVALVGLAVASDTITGAPAWLKPAKFGASVAIYLLTLRYLVGHLTGSQRLVAVTVAATTLALAGELVLIVLQVVRGTSSHFNDATALDGAVFGVMGLLISVVFVAAVAVAVRLLRQRDLDAGLAAGLRWGLAVCLLGMAEAGLMIANRRWSDGGGGHTVGAVDGGPGLPVTGWSTEHGDLRVAHFAGLHGLQLLPLLAFLLATRTGLGARTRARLVGVVGTAYAGVVLLLAWQAERGEPLLRPDGATAAAVLALLLLTLGGAAVVLRGDYGWVPGATVTGSPVGAVAGATGQAGVLRAYEPVRNRWPSLTRRR